MRILILATVAALALAGGATAAEIAVGKSRLEVANDLRLECEQDALYGLAPKNTTQCIAAKLRELDDAIAVTAPCQPYDPYGPGATQNRPECH